MCLAYFYWNPATYQLIIASNRDEFYHRNTTDMQWWDGQILAGKDDVSQGTWLAIGKNGKIAFVTNVSPRQYSNSSVGSPWMPQQHYNTSRGFLPLDFITSSDNAADYAAHLYDSCRSNAELYDGFNLVLFDSITSPYPQAWWINNTEPCLQPISSGFHGISNALLDTPWPKITTGLPLFRQAVASNNPLEAYLPIMQDRHSAYTAYSAPEYPSDYSMISTIADESDPSTGAIDNSEPLHHDAVQSHSTVDRALSARFVHLDNYGTRSTTIIHARRTANTPNPTLHNTSNDSALNPPQGDISVLYQSYTSGVADQLYTFDFCINSHANSAD